MTLKPPKKLEQLIVRYRENRDDYLSDRYKEAEVRKAFIDPLMDLGLLGWDVSNKKGAAEAYKDVINEDAIKIEGRSKAPDYCFTIGGTRKFFLEAKKPSIEIENDAEAALQLRRYGWNKKLPLSILTNFERFIVYDTRVRPKVNDRPQVAQVRNFTFEQLPQEWEYLWNTFSKEAVLKGSFDRYVTQHKMAGTSAVDEDFLEDIENWRSSLARNIALRNDVTQPELNFAVQAILDRIIFLRICEDRGLERPGQLKTALNAPRIYERLRYFFKQADARYNSGLFHFEPEKGRGPPDELTLELEIDDKVLKDVIKRLYYPESPYQFDAIPADILGHVYEQFLGRIVQVTSPNHANVVEKPEVKKAGGVYYTPTPIVSHIVRSTVGALLEGKTPDEIAKIRILDPACGSGNFLVNAYQGLLDWHLSYYVANRKAHRNRLVKGDAGSWFLTTDERKRIVLNNIFGVDIDPQAVEVTKLSLLLKVLEQTSADVVDQNQKFHQERALPDLDKNIRCGNSLVPPSAVSSATVDPETERRINAFDWQTNFRSIMADGGFDAVIGNPPWGAEFSEVENRFLGSKYDSAQGRDIDSYAVFIERAIGLLKPKGKFGFITPDTFLRKDDRLHIRKMLLSKVKVIQLAETGPLFAKVRDTWCLITTAEKDATPSDIQHLKISRFIISVEDRLAKFARGDWDRRDTMPQDYWTTRPAHIVGYLADPKLQAVVAKVEQQPRLGQLGGLYKISRGEEGSKRDLVDDPEGTYTVYIPDNIDYGIISGGIRVKEKTLTDTKVREFYKRPKIWIIRIQKLRWRQRLISAFDARTDTAGMKTLQVIVSATNSPMNLYFLQGILSSSLINFYCTNYLMDDHNQAYLEKIPIPVPQSTGVEIPAYRAIVDVSKELVVARQNLLDTRTDIERTAAGRRLKALQSKLDDLVFDAYGLSAEQRKVVTDFEEAEESEETQVRGEDNPRPTVAVQV